MGRNNQANQRSHLPANRELRRAISADRPRSFGIRRLVEDNHNQIFQATWDALQGAGDIPEVMEPRLRTGVTLLPRRLVGKQMTQGLVLGHRLGRAQADFEYDKSLAGKEDLLRVTCGKVAMLHQRIVYLEVDSEQLRAERERIFNILGSIGLHGVHKSLSKPLHVTLGESDSMLTRVEEKHIVRSLGDSLSAIDSIQLQGWQVYPTVEQVNYTYPEDL